MKYIDKTHREKIRLEQNKNASSYNKQILEATSHLPLISKTIGAKNKTFGILLEKQGRTHK